MFFVQTMIYPFWGLYLWVGSLGLMVSGFTTYEQKSLMDLFNNTTGYFTIYLIVLLTFISSIRIIIHGFLRHKLYMHTVKYFFENVCLEKLEYWDKNYDKTELVKCILTDIIRRSNSSKRQ